MASTAARDKLKLEKALQIIIKVQTLKHHLNLLKKKLKGVRGRMMDNITDFYSTKQVKICILLLEY